MSSPSAASCHLAASEVDIWTAIKVLLGSRVHIHVHVV